MFKSAKIKLTAWYLGIITAITLSFSLFVYRSVCIVTNRALDAQRMRLERRLSRFPSVLDPGAPPVIDPETLSEIKERTLFLIFIINAIILVISGIFSYLLAGITLKPIEEMLSKQKKFVSDAAHDLKTPLTALKTDFEVTLRNPHLELIEAKDTIKSAVTEVDRLTSLVNRLLKQSKYQNSSEVLKKDKVDVKGLVTEAVKVIKPLADEKKINIEVKSVDEELFVIGDGDSLVEVLINILENAVKFSPIEKLVSVSVEHRNNDVITVITDQGNGINRNELDQIFNPFYKTEKSRNSKENKCYGLGLSISNEIIKKHHGTISVESKVGVGSKFTITLPLVKE